MGAGRLLLECPRGLARAGAGASGRDGDVVDRYRPQSPSYLVEFPLAQAAFLRLTEHLAWRPFEALER